MSEAKIAMQPRCIYCKREQYGPAVWDISHAEHPCVWCGKTPPVFATDADWYAAYKGNDLVDERLEYAERLANPPNTTLPKQSLKGDRDND